MCWAATDAGNGRGIRMHECRGLICEKFVYKQSCPPMNWWRFRYRRRHSVYIYICGRGPSLRAAGEGAFSFTWHGTTCCSIRVIQQCKLQCNQQSGICTEVPLMLCLQPSHPTRHTRPGRIRYDPVASMSTPLDVGLWKRAEANNPGGSMKRGMACPCLDGLVQWRRAVGVENIHLACANASKVS